MADDLTVIRSMHTDATNHESGITFLQTGRQSHGLPSIGSWFSYGLGSMNAERSHPRAGVPAMSDNLWSAGGLSPAVRRLMLDGFSDMHPLRQEPTGDPEALARIEQSEMAFKLQSAVPELTDLSSEPDRMFERWGEEAKQAGKF